MTGAEKSRMDLFSASLGDTRRAGPGERDRFCIQKTVHPIRVARPGWLAPWPPLSAPRPAPSVINVGAPMRTRWYDIAQTKLQTWPAPCTGQDRESSPAYLSCPCALWRFSAYGPFTQNPGHSLWSASRPDGIGSRAVSRCRALVKRPLTGHYQCCCESRPCGRAMPAT